MFPGVDGPTPTIYWELCREGVDDCRYVATLQQRISQARERRQREAADRAERVLEPLLVKRVKVGYWVRLGGGTTVPGLGLRQNLVGGPGEGFYYRGGITDPAVWNHFETEGRLSESLESLDIHTWIAVPEAELAREAFFFMDDVSLQAIEEPPLSIATSLDEYYVGEPIPWNVQAGTAGGQVRVELQRDGLRIMQHDSGIQAGQCSGVFESRALSPAIYRLRASLVGASLSSATADRTVILAPDPFDWPVVAKRETK